jgi:hypothetical protein
VRSEPSRKIFKANVKFHHIWFLLVAAMLAGCAEQATPTYYIPPAETGVQQFATQINPEIDLESEPASSTILPTASPECTPGLLFLEDLTIPDGTLVQPGESLDKRWLVQNNGTCNWDHNFGLQLIAGPDLGAPGEKALYPARIGAQAEIQIIFTAPEEPGNYRSAWQANAQNGELFGDPVYIEISVENR